MVNRAATLTLKVGMILMFQCFLAFGAVCSADELSLMDRDQLLKGIYYYQMKIGPQVRRLSQVEKQLKQQRIRLSVR